MAARDLTGLSGPMMNPVGPPISTNKPQAPPKKGPKSLNKKPPGAPKRFKRYDEQVERCVYITLPCYFIVVLLSFEELQELQNDFHN